MTNKKDIKIKKLCENCSLKIMCENGGSNTQDIQEFQNCCSEWSNELE